LPKEIGSLLGWHQGVRLRKDQETHRKIVGVAEKLVGTKSRGWLTDRSAVTLGVPDLTSVVGRRCHSKLVNHPKSGAIWVVFARVLAEESTVGALLAV
ncbi:hypothetical protein BHE74_00059275, partial [Ensete ventricosum]